MRTRPQIRAHAILCALFEPEIRAWRGEAGLARVFWLYGVLTSLGLAMLYALALDAGRRDLQQGLLPVFALYTGWLLVALWRCAAAAPPGWSLLTRSLTIAWAINASLIAGFVQIDLIAALLRAS